MNDDRMVFELQYRFPKETLVSNSELRFLSHKSIEGHLDESGLRIDKLFGDWSAAPFDENYSQEMIFIVRLLG